jgi:uncharacterized protein
VTLRSAPPKDPEPLAAAAPGPLQRARAALSAGPPEAEERFEALATELRGLGRVVVALSGGADSALLAFAATAVLGRDAVLCATAVSASLSPLEREDCAALAREWGLRWREVETRELSNPAYLANDRMRCFHCKSELMAVLSPLAAAEGATVVLGVNLDDLADAHRPGQLAAAEGGARFPLAAAGLTKRDVRVVSRALGLRTWDKPAAPCLASRIPYGMPVTVRSLASVGTAEAGLRALGFRDVRVRHYGELARVELPVDELCRAVERRGEVVAAVRRAGYRYVTLDLEGLRSGNLNGELP